MGILLSSTFSDLEWDQYISRSPKSQIVHTLRWKRMVASVYGFKPLHVAAFQNERLVGVMPLYEVPTLSGKKIVSVPYGFCCDPLYDSEEVLSKFLEHLVSFRQFSLKCEYPINLNGYSGSFVSVQPYLISKMDLSSDYEKVEAGFKKRFRQSLKHDFQEAKNAGIEIRELQSEDELKQFYRVFSSVYKDRFLSLCQPYSFYLALWKTFASSGEVKFLIALNQGKVVGGTVWFFWNKEAYYAWGVGYEFRERVNVLPLLMATLIKRSVEMNCSKINFGISSPAMEGLVFFKERWGAVSEPVHFYQSKDTVVSGEVFSQGLRLRKFLKYVPLPVVSTANKFLARYFAL